MKANTNESLKVVYVRNIVTFRTVGPDLSMTSLYFNVDQFVSEHIFRISSGLPKTLNRLSRTKKNMS